MNERLYLVLYLVTSSLIRSSIRKKLKKHPYTATATLGDSVGIDGGYAAKPK